MTLNQLQVGKEATVVSVSGAGALCRRIFDMGITPGVKVYLRKKAPLGDPLELTVRGYELSIRSEEAKTIEIKEERENG